MVESGDEDDEELQFQADLKRALEASKFEISREVRPQCNSESSTNLSRVNAGVGGSTSSNAFTFLAERAQMEKERQERQRRLLKQQRKLAAHREDDSDVEEPHAKRLAASHSTNASGKNHKASPPSTSDTDSIFWNGEFRQTATRHADPRMDNMATFRLTEVLGQVT
jgi:tyrosyl-DNA phosphodiesterase-1